MRMVVVALLTFASPLFATEVQDESVLGGWHVESYTLKSGEAHDVDGLMTFTASDWTVVYFVKGDDGEPRRGVGAGGPYSLERDELVLTRHYVVIGSDAIGELEAIPLRFTVPDGTNPTVEECRIDVDGERLTITFPSGNRMGFRRSSGS